MKKKLSFLAVLAIIATIWSCDDEYNDLGVNIIGDGHYEFSHYSLNSDYIKTFTKATGSVQTNNLPINALGIYSDPYFGTTKASFVSQVELVSANPTIGYNIEVDSVYLYVPYFYDTGQVTTLDSGARTFVLDSIYGNKTQKFDLKVYENGYFLNDFDPNDNFETAQKYYNDQFTEIEGNAGSTLLNNSTNTAQNSQFYVNESERYIYETDGDGNYVDSNGNELSVQDDPAVRIIKERFTPGIWLDLDKTFFQNKLVEWRNNGSLVNNNLLKNAFRGLYFKVSEINAGQGSMAMLDFTQAQLKIRFRSATTDEANATKVRREISLKLGYNSASGRTSNTINLLSYTPSTELSDYKYSTDLLNLSSTNETTGDERLYLKGGEGSVAYVDLFDETELANLRSKNWLINEARLTFYVDQARMAFSDENALRIYLYDATNETVILDYANDTSTLSNAKLNKYLYGGILTPYSNSGTEYQFRLTDYVKNLLANSSATNVRLGICVTETINNPLNSYLKTPILGMEYVPTANVMNPLGTVLHGSNSTDTTKRPKFEIFYTEPK